MAIMKIVGPASDGINWLSNKVAGSRPIIKMDTAQKPLEYKKQKYKIMTKLFAMVVPILPGQTEHWHRFCDTLMGEKSNEYKASREKLEVRERAFLQQLPQGDMVIVTLEGNDPESAIARFAQGRDAFTQWFLDEVKAIHGLDLASPPKGSMSELYIDSGEVHASTY